MKYEEFRQLSIYSRYDGIYLGILWIVSFSCLIGSSMIGVLGLISEIMIISTPFFVYYKLRKYRNIGLGGYISYGRAFSYCLRLFFNASIVLGIAQWGYMRFLDGGHFTKMLRPLIDTPESSNMLKQIGMTPEPYLQSLDQISPLSFSSSCFIMNIIIGGFLSFIISIIATKVKQ